jgi:hypothetical protein
VLAQVHENSLRHHVRTGQYYYREAKLLVSAQNTIVETPVQPASLLPETEQAGRQATKVFGTD